MSNLLPTNETESSQISEHATEDDKRQQDLSYDSRNLSTKSLGVPEADASLTSMIKSSQSLQQEINGIFAQLNDLNRQVRIDIDDFCNIGMRNSTTLNNVQN
ncbi:hypothetical protein HG535_0F04000 [Zygotorulaspora mrakii]|uniref:Uncharacterized protein n=1 Tax=Zygotorulaspora mrakii TaxID=42260 RepID=A0A7H9B5B2_ZYGMR|nr:uncharacterized protein HG535_0F04000 [Zygotorulaspora mrakii]QLG73888.1 hypothetical protein HG535_0F04000 [Zygotorulaspora mrakii]